MVLGKWWEQVVILIDIKTKALYNNVEKNILDNKNVQQL